MFRYRILSFDFDARVQSLEPIKEHWEENIKATHVKNREEIILGLKAQYGEHHFEVKLENFQALKAKPFSILAFHNRFLEQVRNSFVVGGYYPALTGACALGERILNHLILLLRDDHNSSPEYKKFHRKKSFDSWTPVINALVSWGELLPEAGMKFKELHDKRNRAIHFNPDTDIRDKDLALEAIYLLQDIVRIQFSPFGEQPWYFTILGETYIKKEYENKPIVKHIFIPNAWKVGPKHFIKSMAPEITMSDHEYENVEISDDEFVALRRDFR